MFDKKLDLRIKRLEEKVEAAVDQIGYIRDRLQVVERDTTEMKSKVDFLWALAPDPVEAWIELTKKQKKLARMKFHPSWGLSPSKKKARKK